LVVIVEVRKQAYRFLFAKGRLVSMIFSTDHWRTCLYAKKGVAIV